MAVNNGINLRNQLAKIDTCTEEEAHRLLKNINTTALTEALYSLNRGDLKEIATIHKVAKNVLDQNVRREHNILQTIQQFPDLLSIDNVLSLSQFHLLQRYCSKLPFLIGADKRSILAEEAYCYIGKRGNSKVTLLSNDGNAPFEIVEIINNLCKKVLESAYKLDNELSQNEYKAHIYIARDTRSTRYCLKNGLEMHHDYDYNNDGSPGLRPKYLFLSILSDRDGDMGWNDGHLVIQNDASRYSANVPFKEDKPHLIYEYPLNQAILLRNREVAHQMTGLKSIRSPVSEKLSRELMIVQLYEAAAE